MIKQTLAFMNPAYLSLKAGQLVIDTKSDKGILTRPIEDIGLLVLESHCVTVTTALLSALLDNNVAVMVCDTRHLPTGLLLSINGNTLTTERARFQINASRPLCKQLWQQTVTAKILNQRNVLRNSCEQEIECMSQWARSVRSGDPENIEARAAIFYWKNLIPGRPDYQRGNDDEPINSLLNYGYAILRAIMARAAVGSGLLPQIGLFHSNKYNPYCLADDLMEPYRPYVDRLVLDIIKTYGHETELSVEIKRRLLTIPTIDVEINGLRRPLMIATSLTTSSLNKCFSGESRQILYPDL